MCDLLTISTAALTGTSVVSNLLIQGQEAEAQVDYQERLAKATTDAATHEQTSLRIRQAQEQEATAQEKRRADSATARAKAQAAVEAAGGNVSGASIDSLLSSYEAENARYKGALSRQQTFNDTGVELSIMTGEKQLANNLESLSTPVAAPDFIGAALDFGSMGINAYDSYKTRNVKKPSK
jgi:hypothetical protein